MERLRQVQQLWSWLPAFRAVAETEHLPTAARALHVSPSALSRTVRLLEDGLGMPLFRREGRSLVLNEQGRILLARTRDAMRLVHEGLEELEGAPMRGPLKVASAGAITTPYVVPAVAALLAAWPELQVELVSTPAAEVAGALTRGQIDVAFQSVPLDAPGLDVVGLGEAGNGVWCAVDHPLAGRAGVSMADLTAHPFAAPPVDGMGRTWDGWPVAVPRTVRMRIGQMHVGIEAVAAGGLLALLPDVVARRDARLVRVDIDGWATTPVLAIRRRHLGVDDRVSRVLDAVRAQMTS